MAIFHYQDNIVYRDKMDFVIDTYRDIGISIIAQPYSLFRGPYTEVPMYVSCTVFFVHVCLKNVTY